MAGNGRMILHRGALGAGMAALFVLLCLASRSSSTTIGKLAFYFFAMILISTFACLIVRWFLLGKNMPTLNSLVMFSVPLLLSLSFFFLPEITSLDLDDDPATLLVAYVTGYAIIIYGSFTVLLQYRLGGPGSDWNQLLTAVFAVVFAVLSSCVFLAGPFIDNDATVFGLKLVTSANSLSTAIAVLYVAWDERKRG